MKCYKQNWKQKKRNKKNLLWGRRNIGNWNVIWITNHITHQIELPTTEWWCAIINRHEKLIKVKLFLSHFNDKVLWIINNQLNVMYVNVCNELKIPSMNRFFVEMHKKLQCHLRIPYQRFLFLVPSSRWHAAYVMFYCLI